MEHESRNLGARPPAFVDGLLRLLIPPAAREDVMGDLWERYNSPLQYAAEGARTLPYVVASRTRRTSSLPVVGLQTFILIACLGVTLPDGGGEAVPSWATGGIPTAAALIGLILRNAYRGEEAPLKRGVLDAVTAAVCVLLSQAAIGLMVGADLAGPAWLLPPGLYILGALALPILCILGAAEGSDGKAGPGTARPSAETITEDYARFEARVRVRNGAEMIALAAIVALSSFLLWRLDPPAAPFGWTCVAGYSLLIFYLAARGSARPLHPGLPRDGTMALYQGELARQDRLRRWMWWFWFVPLFAGLITNLVMVGIARDRPLQAATGVAAFVLLAFFIAGANRARSRRVRDKIGDLAAANA